MNKKHFIACGIGYALLTTSVWADDAPTSCGTLHVQITNNTSNICEMTDTYIYRGLINSSIPKTIAPNASASFDISQVNLYGPDVQLSYNCGYHPTHAKITIRSHQNYCMLKAGDISGSIVDSENMRATYTSEEGSYGDAAPGHINWLLSLR